MAGDKDFTNAIAAIKVPMLILDQKWHRLFALGGKPSEVLELEKQEKELLEKEASLKKELKDLKKVKEGLMSSVMSNMEGTSDLVSKKLDDDKRLLEECKERIQAAEDDLLELPGKQDSVNKELMVLTMNFCYDKLRTNTEEAEEITNWIKDVRVKLKKNVVRKHNREINNKEIYSYMHDVFGMDVLNIFDMQNQNFLLGDLDDKLSEEQEKKATEDLSNAPTNPDDPSDVKLEDVDLDAIAKEALSGSDAIDENTDSDNDSQE